MRLCEKNILKIFQDNILEAFRKAKKYFHSFQKSSRNIFAAFKKLTNIFRAFGRDFLLKLSHIKPHTFIPVSNRVSINLKIG
jgi:hypothetical protein